MARPAAHDPDGQAVAWGQGHLMPLHRVSLDELRCGSSLVVEEAEYFGARLKVAGTIQRIEAEAEEKYLAMALTGTDSEEVLKVYTLDPRVPFRLHLCSNQCDRMESGDHLIHGIRGRTSNDMGEPAWVTSLVGVVPPLAPVDQLRDLRQRALDVGPGPAPGHAGGVQPVGGDDKSEEEKEKKKAKKKKRKERKEEEKIYNGKRPSRAVQKDHQALYSGTGLDQKEKVRRRVMSRAKKLASRKRPKSRSSSGSGSSSSSTSVDAPPLEGESVFLEESKARVIAERCPGALAMEGIASMRRNLLTTTGEELQDNGIKPLAVLYYRSILSRKATGAQGRELLNLCTCIDALLRNRPASALDVLMQRVKAQEAQLQGQSWQVAQQMEIPQSEASMLAPRGEVEDARRQTYQESKTLWQSHSQMGGPKGDGKQKGKGKYGKSKDDKKDGSKEKGKGTEKK